MDQNVGLLERIIVRRWVAKMWMVSGHTFNNGIRNKDIRNGLIVANIEEKLKENRLR